MRHTTLFCVMVAAAAIAGNAEAIYKCTTAKGVVYQDRPCRDGAETDVQIVIPTGEIAPKSSATQDDEAQANSPRVESRFGAPRSGRAANDNAVTVTKPTDRKSSVATTTRRPKKDARSAADNARVPMTADAGAQDRSNRQVLRHRVVRARRRDARQMNCESPTGEKRVFYLSNGKLTSI